MVMFEALEKGGKVGREGRVCWAVDRCIVLHEKETAVVNKYIYSFPAEHVFKCFNLKQDNFIRLVSCVSSIRRYTKDVHT